MSYIGVEYMTDYPIPAKFGGFLLGEFSYDEEVELHGTVDLGIPMPNSGWLNKIFDFKVLSN